MKNFIRVARIQIQKEVDKQVNKQIDILARKKANRENHPSKPKKQTTQELDIKFWN